MKTKYLGFLAIILVFLSCEKYDGNYVQVDIQTGPFEELYIDAAANLWLEQGPYYSVTLEGYEPYIDDYIFEVTDGTLWITQLGSRSKRGTKIYITMPDLWLLESQKSADITSINQMTINHDLILINDGGGDLNLSIDAQNLYLEMYGSGDVWLNGYVNYQEVDINGSGSYQAYNLDSYRARIRTFGYGDAQVWVQDYLYAGIRGSGDIYFQGFPYVDYSIIGSGNVINMN